MQTVDFGELVYPKFYGPGVERRRESAREQRKRRIAFPLVLSIPVAAGILLGVKISGWTGVMIGLPLILFATLITAAFWWLAGRDFEDRSMRRTRAGTYDWDMYENGILAKREGLGRSVPMKTYFIPFSNISRVIIRINRVNARFLLTGLADLLRDDEDFLPEDYSYSEEWLEGLSCKVWLVGTDGALREDMLGKKQFDDLAKFEALIRRKVKTVE